MAKVQHKDLPDNQLHEPKGASTASARTLLMANGDGTTSFRPLEPSDLYGISLPPASVLKAVDTRYSWSSIGLSAGEHTSGAYISKTAGGVTPGLPTIQPYHISFVEDTSYPQRLSDLGTDFIQVTDDTIRTEFVALVSGWYYFKSKVFLTKYSNTTNHKACVTMYLNDDTLIDNSFASRMVNGSIAEFDLGGWVFMEEGDAVSFCAGVEHSSIVPLYLSEDLSYYTKPLNATPPREEDNFYWHRRLSYVTANFLGATL